MRNKVGWRGRGIKYINSYISIKIDILIDMHKVLSVFIYFIYNCKLVLNYRRIFVQHDIHKICLVVIYYQVIKRLNFIQHINV